MNLTTKTIHGIPTIQTRFHVYDPYWRRRPQGVEQDGNVFSWRESNLLDRFISLLQSRPYTRKELGYIALKNGYERALVSQCLDLLPILEYIDLWDDTYLYTLPAEVKPEDVW